MGFIMEFKDEDHYSELVSKMHKAKKAVCEAFEAIEKADNTSMSERDGHYRDGYRGASYRDDYRRGAYRSGGSYRDDEEYDYRGRDGMGRFS
jgi:hypothetical protein